MKRPYILTPILWGFFLSTSAFCADTTAHLKTSLHHRDGFSQPPSTAVERHLRVLAIRVEFQPDTLSTTTGEGTFESGISQDAIVDPLPHDRTYFEDHLRFLNNYFSEVSDSHITLDDFAVFPVEPTGAYTLPHQMWHYNYNYSGVSLDSSLAELFVDAWEAAAQDPDVDPQGWDTFVIFHAGIGQDFSVGFDETPHDIPSAYFTLEDLRFALEEPDSGILVNGTYVTGGLLLPESERQYEVDAEIALNGTAVLLFAQWMGLPALYNTENGLSGVGRFDLMDQGSGNFAGMIPAQPGAWSRTFMGWAEPQMIVPGAVSDTFSVYLHGRGDPTDPERHEIYRVNLNPSEYFLIENRSWDPDSLGYTIAYDRQDRRLKIHDNYTVELLDGDFGVIDRVDNYDFGIQGAGILVWRVDEEVIEANYAQNRVNADPDHRGVSVVEADGAEDIGQPYGFLDIGYGTELGWAGDFFFASNGEFLAANSQPGPALIFQDDTFPGTRTHDGSLTGLRMGFISSRNTVMQFWVKNDWAQAGFPRQLAGPPGDLSPSALDFDGDGRTDWILTVTPGGAIQAFDAEGNAQGDSIETRWTVDLLGDSTEVVDTLLARVDAIGATPAVDVDSGSFAAFMHGGPGTFHFLRYTLATGEIHLESIYLEAGALTGVCTPMLVGSGPDRRWYGSYQGGLIAFEESPAGDLQSVGNARPFAGGEVLGFCLSDSDEAAPIFMLSNQDSAALISSDFEILKIIELPFTSTFPPITLLHQAESRRDLVVVGSGGEVVLIDPDDGSFRPGFPVNVGMEISAPPTAADFDRDGWLEVILMGPNRIVGVQANGSLSPNWPLTIDNRRPSDPIESPPAISELDDELRVLFGWPGGSVDARDNWGRSAQGFARSTGGEVRSAPLLVQLDEDDEAELLALDESGALYAWNLQGLGDFDDQRRPWNGLQCRNNRQGVAFDWVDVIEETRLLVTSKVYPWPNPADQVVHIRYKMGQEGRISVRIFDGAGDLVKELEGSAQAGIEDDLIWDLSDVSSGVYLGRVEAEAGGKTEKTFIKIAVVK